MAHETADTLIAPFTRMFVLLLEGGERIGQMAFQAICASLHGEVFGRSGRHRLSLVLRGKEIERADDGDDDDDENQVTRLHGDSQE